METDEYKGDEPAVPLGDTSGVDLGTIFDVRAPGIPPNAAPVFDDSVGAVVGYRAEVTTGVFRLYDLNGKVVGMEEKGLESPLLDPIDLLFLGGVLRVFGRGLIRKLTTQTTKAAAGAAVGIKAGRLAASVVGVMRMVFKGLTVGQLKFTATTAARMATPGRHVPLHILHLAVKYGHARRGREGIGQDDPALLVQMTPPLLLTTTPRDERCTARIAWDPESAVLHAVLAYPEAATTARAASFADQVDERLGSRPSTKRLILGDLDLVYRDGLRIDSLELRTAPAEWRRQPIDDVPAAAEPVWLEFAVPYDGNGIFSADIPLSIAWDALTDRFALSFSTEPPEAWFRMADTIAVGITAAGALAELRFFAVEVPAVG
jgi:hypothetical protein